MTGLADGTAADVAAANAVSLDCFDTLLTAEHSGSPWDAVARELRAREVPVPDDWESAYRTSHVDFERGAELALSRHVVAALASRGIDCARSTAQAAVFAAFDSPVTVRPGARQLLEALREQGIPVAVVSNCAVQGLVEASLERAGLLSHTNSVVTSVDCGWRKPDPRPFEVAAEALGVAAESLVHVGDDPRADGGVANAGGTGVLLSTATLSECATAVEGSTCR